MKSLFSLYNIPRLKEIVVEDCEMMKEIISHHGRDGILPNIQISQLQKLTLSRLPKLVQFIAASLSDQTESDKQSIEDSVSPLFNGQDVVKDELGTESSCSEITCQPHPLGPVEEHHDMVFKAKLLSELRLPLMCFQNLTVLMVKDCDGLISLLSPSTAKSLSQRLTKLGISGCKSLRQVANDQKEADDDDGIRADSINIIFRQLNSLILDDLPNLTSFYSGNKNVVLQFPYLYELVVSDCPEMKTFYHGSIECPSLHRIYLRMKQRRGHHGTPSTILSKISIEWRYQHRHSKAKFLLESDINTTIQKLWEEKEYDSTATEETCKQNVENAQEDHEVGTGKRKAHNYFNCCYCSNSTDTDHRFPICN
ncbi:hypothetical protein FNV43_RR04603 [Rhamnella rubrinervis]|uniref:Disease resistance protein At4g27190-like leucine-rich repeats domain-containing protein n=1 Tax=Rhamnella rubrinervis TaxID=2594499 RepID=A0A8K0HJU8_9ROSA|nr:hypothetical protein FNV43_RR04603 [Rhamnella rubrinervis]